MNNEIGRKLTSLTLMTIMLAGGMTIAAPSMMPQAAAAGALYVSAENAEYDNKFGGFQIVEIIVKDPNRSDTDEAEGEPVVRVNSNVIRMVQGADGYWYAYIGNNASVVAGDVADNNLNFGTQGTVSGVTNNSGTINMYHTVGAGVIGNSPGLSNWNSTTNADGSTTLGQIGLQTSSQWPFIQTLDLTMDNFDIILEQAGANEVVTLDWETGDMDEYAGISFDRMSATQGAEIFIEITDPALNIDPTAEDIVIFKVRNNNTGSLSSTAGLSGDRPSMSFTNGTLPVAATAGYLLTQTVENSYFKAATNDFGDNGLLTINNNTNGAATVVLANGVTIDDDTADEFMVFWETSENSGKFVNYDDADNSNLEVSSTAKRGTTATFNYNADAYSFVVANDFGTIDMDESSVGDVWNSGEEMTVILKDQDFNKNTLSDEDIVISSPLVPSLQIGSPLSLGNGTTIGGASLTEAGAYYNGTTVSSFSKIAEVDASYAPTFEETTIDIVTDITVGDLFALNDSGRFAFINYDITSLTSDTAITGISIVDKDDNVLATTNATGSLVKGLEALTINGYSGSTTSSDVVILNFTATQAIDVGDDFYVDFFSFRSDDTAKANNAIYRLYLEETDDNTGEFVGSVEYLMLNQLNTDKTATYSDWLVTASDEIQIIVHEDLTDEDSPRINYLDLGADGVSTQIADQVEAPSHSGSVSFDSDNYKIADTVVITLDDQDLNTDSELIDVYITSTTDDLVGDGSGDHILDVTFDDLTWASKSVNNCSGTITGDDGLAATGFTLVETDVASGIFTGSFQVPTNYCNSSSDTIVGVTGTDIEVNYNDFRDASGQTIEVGDGASINANTGSVAFDRTVYPVPYGSDLTGTTTFKIHATANGGTAADLDQGDVIVHVRVTDADYDISATGEDVIKDTTVVMKIERGSASTTLATVGNSVANQLVEVSPDSGVFEYDQTVTYTSGPTDNCPTAPAAFSAGCILQGDIITVTYTDNQDASGKSQTVTDSATFDLRNGVLQSDKSVYLIGSDMILTLIEPDFDRDNDETESYTLDLIEWDSDAAETSMGPLGIANAAAAFDPEPSLLRETGDSTGIFQVVVEIPDTLGGEVLDRGEKIDLEYTDWGPAGADFVGQEDEDIGLTVYTSNFGATIELDQKVYTWTDKVYITVVAPDHNFDSGLVDEIGETANDAVKVSTRGNEIDQYKLVESGADTGIFIGEVTLTGMKHDADGDGTDDISAGVTSNQATQSGPTEGQIATTDNDGLTVSFEFSEDETVVGSALVRWNIGEVQWLEASYPASGTGVIRVIDADMNLDPEAIDNFDVDAWSDSDAGGIDLTVTETNEATGIFEGTVFFTTTNESSGHRLRVAEGDTVTAEYEDNTLPEPYTTADELDITATSLIGTVVPPLERAPAANLRTVDAFGNSLTSVSVDQQVQISAELANGQDREQAFAYLVQVQDGDGVTVSLAWITGSLSSGQSFSPALSWIPTESGSYTATAFVWESVDNPTALSPPVSTTITVQ